MSLLGIKYHVPSQGITGKNQIWRIYKNIDQGYTDTVYCEHIEIEEGIDSWTGNMLYKVGYSLLCEGDLEVFIDPETGLRHARIFK